MSTLDLAIVAFYLLVMVAVGLAVQKKGSEGIDSYFLDEMFRRDPGYDRRALTSRIFSWTLRILTCARLSPDITVTESCSRYRSASECPPGS